MKKELEALERLQAVELEIAALERRIRQIPQRVEELRRDITEAETGLRAAEASLIEGDKERRRLESEVADLNAKISKYQDQSLQVKTNIEYQAILKEISGTKAKIDATEIKIIENLEAADDLRSRITDERRKTAQLQGRVQDEIQQIESEVRELERDLAAFREEREARARELPAEVLRAYERIRDARGGMALSAAEGELCSACRVRIRPQHLANLKAGLELVTCEHCQRILIWKETAAAGGDNPSPT